jgi:hypothetical protein
MDWSKRTFRLMRSVGEPETTKENIHKQFELDSDPVFQLLTEEDIATVIHFTSITYIITFPIYLLSKLFFLSGLSPASLIWIII